MRIDGTEAVSFNTPNNTPKINSVDISTNNNVRPDVTEVKSRVADRRSPSQITEFERRELPVSEQVVIDAIERINRALSGYNRRFEISIHEKTNGIMVKVIDSDTNQLIREIPPEKILDMVAKLWELAGLIVDERR